MAERTNTKKTQTKTTPRQTAKRTTVKQEIKEPVVVQETEHAQGGPVIPKEVDLNQYITVKNGFHGRLVYISSRTGEKFIWDDFGDEQEIELRELRNAKNSSKGFFVNNWFVFDDAWVIDYLGVRKYYKYVINIDDFDKIFELEPDELGEAVSQMSDAQKRSVIYRASRLIADGTIDSRRTISTLEEALGVELVEH